MSMTSQGFPLWAVHAEGDVYAVVGWDVRESISYPHLVPLGGNVRGMVVEDGDQVFRYTTTDPTEQPERWTIAAPDDLRERLTAFADELDGRGHGHPYNTIANRIRGEVSK